MREIAARRVEDGLQVFHDLMCLLRQRGIVQRAGDGIKADLAGDVEDVAVSDGLVVGTDRSGRLIGANDCLCHGKQKSLNLGLSLFFAKKRSMWVLIGETEFIKNRLGIEEVSSIAPWTIASADADLPKATLYLDLSGCFARYRPESASADAWWIVHAPAYTLSELPPRTIRVNTWPGFAAGSNWEMVCANHNAEQLVREALQALKKDPVNVPDRIGLIGARVLAAIINEGFLLMGEGAATRTDIDLAMKLGTNYPSGPFEWAERIGWGEVNALLKRLAETETRYEPAAAWKELI